MFFSGTFPSLGDVFLCFWSFFGPWGMYPGWSCGEWIRVSMQREDKIQNYRKVVHKMQNNTPKCLVSCHTLPEISVGISGRQIKNYYLFEKKFPARLISQVSWPLPYKPGNKKWLKRKVWWSKSFFFSWLGLMSRMYRFYIGIKKYFCRQFLPFLQYRLIWC